MEVKVLNSTEIYENGLVIAEGESIAAADGKKLIMTVNGVVTDPKPGKYDGKVVLEIIDKMPPVGKTQMPSDMFIRGESPVSISYDNEYRCALALDVDEAGNTVILENMSATSALVGSEYDAAGIKGGSVTSKMDCVNGIFVRDGKYRIENMKFDFEGNGGHDFQFFGACIAAAGNSEVVINNVDIKTKGVIATSVAAGECANVLIKDTKIYTEGVDNSDYWPNAMTESPWVLGLDGTVRSSNVVHKARAIYYNVDGESNGWGVYSTDNTSPGCRHELINCKGIIKEEGPYASGYGAYVLSANKSCFLGMEFDVPSYPLVMAGASNDVVVGSSSLENLKKFIGEDSLLAKETNGFADVEEKKSVFRAGKNAAMWHSGGNGCFFVLPGTELISGSTTFLVKSVYTGMPGGPKGPGAHPQILVEDAKLVPGNGVVLHLMQNDDPGMGTFGHDGHWAEYYEVPEVVEKARDGLDITDPDAAGTTKACFKNMEVNGSIYNSRWTEAQNLAVKFDGAKVTGTISSGIQSHVNFKPGEKIYPKDRTELGNVSVQPSPAVCNGVIVELEKSVWNAVGTSYLTALTIGEGSSVVCSSMTVNGEAVEPKAGTYKGRIIIIG